MESKHFEEGTYLLPTLLGEVADQVAERMHLVWSDETRPGSHPYRAVSGYNASLSIEWGRSEGEDEDGLPRRFETEWSKKYPDSEVYSQELEILLHGVVIFRMGIALVDGARCWIPFPDRVSGADGYEVTNWEVAVVGLANDLVHNTETLNYVRDAGINIVERPPLVES